MTRRPTVTEFIRAARYVLGVELRIWNELPKGYGIMSYQYRSSEKADSGHSSIFAVFTGGHRYLHKRRAPCATRSGIQDEETLQSELGTRYRVIQETAVCGLVG